jgi:hypothetical protein
MEEQGSMKAFRSGIMVLAISLAVTGFTACSRTNQPRPPAPDAGVPVYPGAQELSDGFSKHLLPQDRAKLIHAVMYETSDPPSKVISFYKEKLKGKSQVLETKTHGIPSAAIRAEVDGQYKLLVITANEDTGRTEIVIGNIQNPPAAK